MFRKLLGVIGFVAMLAVASSAHAQTWTAVASSGALDNFSLSTYSSSFAMLGFNTTASANVNAIYNVTNLKDSGNPAWTTLEFTARVPSPGGLNTFATAGLYRVPKGSATQSVICTALAPGTSAISTSSCTFSSALIDFANYNYFVRVSLGRDSGVGTVAAYGLRVF
jgi:hypothetical protein